MHSCILASLLGLDGFSEALTGVGKVFLAMIQAKGLNPNRAG